MTRSVFLGLVVSAPILAFGLRFASEPDNSTGGACPHVWVGKLNAHKTQVFEPAMKLLQENCTCGMAARASLTPEYISFASKLGIDSIKTCFFVIQGIPYTIFEPESAMTAELTAMELNLEDEVVEHYGSTAMKWDLKDGDVVLDIGANLGMFSILTAKRYPGVQLHSYEANPSTAAYLKMNVEYNGLASRISAKSLALSGDGRTLTFTKCSNLNIGRNGVYESNIQPFQGEQSCVKFPVPSTTLQDIIDTEHISEITALKIDCEGCEYEIYSQVLRANPQHLVGECHEFAGKAGYQQLKREFCSKFETRWHQSINQLINQTKF